MDLECTAFFIMKLLVKKLLKNNFSDSKKADILC